MLMTIAILLQSGP